MTDKKQESSNDKDEAVGPSSGGEGKAQNEKQPAKSEKKIVKDAAVEQTQQEEQANQLVKLQGQLDAVSDKYLRAEAEIQNVQTHAKKEQSDLIKYSGQQLAHDILPIVDNLQRALEVEVADESGKQLKTGVEMVLKHLNKALADNGVEVIDSLNKPFDPTTAQAVQTIDADDEHPKDTVTSVLQSGYRLKDRVLRPAMVVVSK